MTALISKPQQNTLLYVKCNSLSDKVHSPPQCCFPRQSDVMLELLWSISLHEESVVFFHYYFQMFEIQEKISRYPNASFLSPTMLTAQSHSVICILGFLPLKMEKQHLQFKQDILSIHEEQDDTKLHSMAT